MTYSRLKPGINDLFTKNPQIAAQADGWDPSTVTYASAERKQWKCTEGHVWLSSIYNRTAKASTGCPVCAGRKILSGVNDLKTLYPSIAKEADGWDPSHVSPGSNKKMPWKCACGYCWLTAPVKRTSQKTNCPACAGNICVTGINDLLSTFPKIAEEASGWDPSKVAKASSVKLEWKCSKCSHKWETTPGLRTKQSTGCPKCAASGYKITSEACIYLLQKPNCYKIGISNVLHSRMKKHDALGWTLIDVIGPIDGGEALRRETRIKQWLSEHLTIMEGTKECWRSVDLEVSSIQELEAKILNSLFP